MAEIGTDAQRRGKRRLQAVRLTAGLGVCVLVRGAVVAWFADFDGVAEGWCTENHFGEWLTWRAAAPIPIPLTEAETTELKRRADALIVGMRIE